jgi:hypothetical protein
MPPQEGWRVRNSRRQEELVRSLLARDEKKIQAEEYFWAVMQKVGGPEQMAQITADILNDRKTGPETKRRLLENLLSLMKWVQSSSGPPADFSQASEAELEELVRRALGGGNGQPTGQGQAGEARPAAAG